MARKDARPPREVHSAETHERMLLAIIVGEVPEANNAAERRLRDTLTREVAEIHSQGGVVDIPQDWPDF